MAANGKFDRAALMDRVDQDVELLGELFEDYLEDKDEHLEKLRAGVSASDAKTVYEGAHALRGCVANFCATSAFEVATQLQNLATAGDMGAVPSTASRLEKELDALTEALRAFVSESQGN